MIGFIACLFIGHRAYKPTPDWYYIKLGTPGPDGKPSQVTVDLCDRCGLSYWNKTRPKHGRV